MDRLTSMMLFTKASELGSFAATADAMNLSPQMIAKHIAYLEYRLGTTLIHRTTRKQTLTDVGQHYYQHCKRILNDIEEIESFAQQLQQEPKGHLKISAPVTFGTYNVAPFITQFLQKYPEIDVELVLSDQYVSAIDDGFDVLIRIGDVQDTTLTAHPLQPYQLVACAAPNYLEEMGTPKTPDELKQHNCLVYGSRLLPNSCQWCFSQNQNIIHTKVQGNFISNQWNALFNAALEGLGVILGPINFLQKEIQTGRLIAILNDYEAPQRPMHILYPANRKPTAKVLTFVNAFMTEFGKKTKP
ncbi:DNA-binding transcriptional LysR family regulator [Acinetobacter baylyi]|uniref:DNA-binding transcriptional LysR family regulator n=1 Tax=Acinetobacter baylyi TaxID=202950 RepID=A0ABU0UY49_ACIBI|nr:LysR family transcriptional regulator [Acinetobacter baylyi]MDQ1209183.1 DNA-binding transcriptional LysR family regulator [Acinetobacter baylyi]MDR6107225.1 DNA-binding transcriptional LysR family regulator [Acinetobacter baylyi]MDR6186052.1 DNA-binding transcriptional LysR family regulator [Acinetobacter baylyi]